MKKLLAILLSLLLILSLTACGGDDTDTPDDTSTPPVETPDPVENDQNAEGGEDELNLWDLSTLETPDMEGTTWNFAGGYLDGDEMTLEDAQGVLEMYGGSLQFVFGEDGSAQMVQGNGSAVGTYEYVDTGVSMDLTYDAGELHYDCIFIDLDGMTMVAMRDGDGTNGIYFVQE